MGRHPTVSARRSAQGESERVGRPWSQRSVMNGTGGAVSSSVAIESKSDGKAGQSAAAVLAGRDSLAREQLVVTRFERRRPAISSAVERWSAMRLPTSSLGVYRLSQVSAQGRR